MEIGVINEITRYPVKSFTGEKIDQTHVMEYGLYGDRSHAFLDKTRPGKFLTITQMKEMVTYSAKFVGEESFKEYPEVVVTTPSGKKFNWNENELLQEMERLSNRSVERVTYSPLHVPLGPIEEDHLLLVTDASVNELRRIWGQSVDYRRFRPNLFISLYDKTPFLEDQWLGRTISIGNHVKIKVNRHCERCMIITVNPTNSEMNASLLKTIVKERKNRFGVLASVIQTGTIHKGDSVQIIDN